MLPFKVELYTRLQITLLSNFALTALVERLQ